MDLQILAPVVFFFILTEYRNSSLNHPGDRREDGADFRRGLILGFTKILPNITKFPTYSNNHQENSHQNFYIFIEVSILKYKNIFYYDMIMALEASLVVAIKLVAATNIVGLPPP